MSVILTIFPYLCTSGGGAEGSGAPAEPAKQQFKVVKGGKPAAKKETPAAEGAASSSKPPAGRPGSSAAAAGKKKAAAAGGGGGGGPSLPKETLIPDEALEQQLTEYVTLTTN